MAIGYWFALFASELWGFLVDLLLQYGRQTMKCQGRIHRSSFGEHIII